MAKRLEVPAPAPPAQGTQVTETRKFVIPTEQPTLLPTPAPLGEKSTRETLNTWFANLDPHHRANGFMYYLKRLDESITIVDENLEGRARGKMLDRLEPDTIVEFSKGSFLDELQVWTKNKYGGGKYLISITNKKTGVWEKNVAFEVMGEPILSPRERWVNGQPSPANMPTDGPSFVPLLMKMIDDKLSGIRDNRQDPNEAMSQVSKAVLEANSQALKWMMDSMPKPTDPVAQLEQMRAYVSLFREMQPTAPAPGAVNPIDNLQNTIGLIKSVRELDRPATPQPDMVKQIVEGVSSAVGQVTGGRGSRGTDWSWLGPLVEKLVPPAIMLLTARMQQPRVAPGPPQFPAIGRPSGPSVVSPGPGPGPTIGPRVGVPGPTINNPAPAPPAPAPAAPGPAAISAEDKGAILYEYAATRLVQMLQEGATGDNAASALDDMFPEIADQLATMNVEAMKWYMANHPILSQAQGHPRLDAFMAEFIGYYREAEQQPAPAEEEAKPN